MLSLARLRTRTNARQFRWLALWLAATLLATQALGQWHSLVHSPGQAIEKKLAFGHELGSKDCQLFDQLSQDLGLECPAPVWQPLATAQPAPLAVPEGQPLAAPREARAPRPPAHA